MKNIDYGNVNLYITKGGGDVNQPKISTKVYPYMGKKTFYPSPNFRVNYCYKGTLPAYKTLNEEVVSETSINYPPIYGKGSCVLIYNDLKHLSIQVSLRRNFQGKLEEV